MKEKISWIVLNRIQTQSNRISKGKNTKGSNFNVNWCSFDLSSETKLVLKVLCPFLTLQERETKKDIVRWEEGLI